MARWTKWLKLPALQAGDCGFEPRPGYLVVDLPAIIANTGKIGEEHVQLRGLVTFRLE